MNRTALGVMWAVATCTSFTWAGPLATDPNAFNGWHGSTPFSTPAFAGYVDWAVYYNQFPAGMTGYVPTPGNSFVYTYQVYSTSGSALRSIIATDAPNLGSFTTPAITGEPVSNFNEFGWSFTAINPGSSSVGLISTSWLAPDFMAMVFSDQDPFDFSGDVGVAFVPIPWVMPEPSMFALGVLGIATMLVVAARRSARAPSVRAL